MIHSGCCKYKNKKVTDAMRTCRISPHKVQRSAITVVLNVVLEKNGDNKGESSSKQRESLARILNVIIQEGQLYGTCCNGQPSDIFEGKVEGKRGQGK
ncbi:hypothetical protein PR048_014020 [Dryococelus australis]|uniref:Uncharacterized protein n=1 Tax=Dryococelus australis TaxID=614101 RepID=A0ABQ9HTV0_9NEOP|nr:hypothetical protein PR048_014020 [Dryococelus australis]